VGREPPAGHAMAYGDFIREEIAKWRGVVAAAKLQLQ
jgi:hypothetical protein